METLFLEILKQSAEQQGQGNQQQFQENTAKIQTLTGQAIKYQQTQIDNLKLECWALWIALLVMVFFNIRSHRKLKSRQFIKDFN